MTNLKVLTIVSAGLLPLATQALAADAISAQPAPPAPVVVDIDLTNWAGGYAGIYLGGAANAFKNKAPDGSMKNNNAKFGFYSGWNFQDGNMIYGLEGDAGYNDARVSDNALTERTGFDGSLRGRLGYDMGAFMPYVTAGLAGTQVKYSDGLDSNSKFRLGWTAGVGTETMLTKNISARIEYRYSDFGKKDIALGESTLSGSALKSQDIRVGIGYKF